MVTPALAVPGVDGLTLLLGWTDLEPSRGAFHWNDLDQWIAAAAQANKKITLAVRAGQDTPCWLFSAPACGSGYAKPYAGAVGLNFMVSPREGQGQTACNPETIAAPWDPVFQSEWDSLLAAIAAHLKSAGTYDSVTSVRLSGINRTTPELRLPAEILTSPCVTNSVSTWIKASPPFRPSLVLDAWDKLTNSFLRNFPDKLFSVDIIPTASGSDLEYPFPAIDEKGCAYQPPWPADPNNPNYAGAPCFNTAAVPDQNGPLLALASQRFAGRLAVAYENLDLSQPAQPYVSYAAQTWGTAIGFQTNDYDNFQRAACSGGSAHPGPCTSATYLALLEVGIFPQGKSSPLRAEYIEVLPPDAIAFPDAIKQAHDELTPPAISLVANAEGESPVIAPNTWVEIKGFNLAPEGDSRTWTGADFKSGKMPTVLDGVSATVNGKNAYVYYISPSQVNILTPPDAISGPVQVIVNNNNALSLASTATAQGLSPSFFVFNGGPYVVATHASGALIGPTTLYAGLSTPAKPGETIVIYANGFGATSTPIVSGSPMQSGTLSPLPEITIGGIAAAVQFAGLNITPGEFQFNVVVPPNVPDGDLPITAAYGGAITQSGTLVTVQR
jgi:uncharacterized protein (TIGR03437 family)